MNPNHLILAAAVILGFVVAFGARTIIKFYRSQKQAEKDRDTGTPQ